MKSIKLKLVLLYLTLVFIVMIVSGTFILTRVRSQETGKSVSELKDTARSIDEQVVRQYDPAQFADTLQRLYQFSNREGHILDARGNTIASTTPADRRERFVNSAIISALAGVPGESVDQALDSSQSLGAFKDWVNYAQPVYDEESNVVYVIFVRSEAETMNARLREISMTISLSLVLSLTLTGMLGFLFAGTLTGPIATLTKKAKEFAQGDLAQEITVYSNDEIGQLTESFNNMAQELNEIMSSMASEKNKMEVILNNMTDGVLAYDSGGVLLHANASSSELLGIEDVESIGFSRMMSILGARFTDLRRVRPEQFRDSVVETGDKFLSTSFTPYSNPYGRVAGIVIVIQDVTKHKKLDDMRKEFVANVSHEIRTPLTTIKSYTETLLEGALSDQTISVDFLGVINSETDRMALLTKDLLDLSRFDNQQLNMELGEISLIEVLRESVRQTAVMAENKNQTIIFNQEEGDYFIMGDGSRLNQVFNNIISNAVKYSHEGSVIEITANERPDRYIITIQDHGMGIPKKDLERIFERFYRVDKARSRAMGGTGLGLSIASEIMEAHNGAISAKSNIGEGTTMELTFPKQTG